MAKRKKISAELKAKIALEAIKELSTAQEIAQKYEVHPTQVSAWKREFLANASSVFEKSNPKKSQEEAKEKDRLYKKVGELQMHVDFLKKNLGEL